MFSKAYKGLCSKCVNDISHIVRLIKIRYIFIALFTLFLLSQLCRLARIWLSMAWTQASLSSWLWASKCQLCPVLDMMMKSVLSSSVWSGESNSYLHERNTHCVLGLLYHLSIIMCFRETGTQTETLRPICCNLMKWQEMDMDTYCRKDSETESAQPLVSYIHITCFVNVSQATKAF